MSCSAHADIEHTQLNRQRGSLSPSFLWRLISHFADRRILFRAEHIYVSILSVRHSMLHRVCTAANDTAARLGAGPRKQDPCWLLRVLVGSGICPAGSARVKYLPLAGTPPSGLLWKYGFHRDNRIGLAPLLQRPALVQQITGWNEGAPAAGVGQTIVGHSLGLLYF